MPLLLEQIAPSSEVDIFGDRVDEQTWFELAGRASLLPVCNYIDLRNSILYSHDPYRYEEDNRVAFPERGEAYAWRRLPRFLDRFKEIRERMRETCPNELILSLDVGSSTPIYSEMMRAHWLRKCGDHAQRALGYAVDIYGDKSKQSNAMLAQHMRRDSEFKNAFISCMQIALYCIPYEISGDKAAIHDYLENTMLALLANSRRFIDRKERKNPRNLELMYSQLDIEFDPSKIKRIPMERAWRIDMVLGPTQDHTPHEILASTTYRSDLNKKTAKEVQSLYKRAGMAKSKGDLATDVQLRKEAAQILGSRVTNIVGLEQSAYLLSELLDGSIEWVISQGLATPVRFMSLDRRDPRELLEEAKSSLDAETKLCGFGRRTFERLGNGDPDHLHDEISSISEHIAPETVASITSIDSYPFYAEQPKKYRDTDRIAFDIASNMLALSSRLKRRGEYMTFPWGRMPEINSGSDRAVRLALDHLPGAILSNLTSANSDGQFTISTDHHSAREVHTWMSQGEFDELTKLSPAVDLGSDRIVEVLRIKRLKKPTPAGRLLGPAHLNRS